MPDLFDQLPAPLDPPTSAVGRPLGAKRVSANGKRIGRPPGAQNRGSLQLGKYLEAQFGGMTPGQQSAEMALVKPGDVARAKADAGELVRLGLLRPVVLDLGIPKLQLAQIVKAVRLAIALGCDTRDAYLLGQKEREGLLKYVHQVLPPAKDGAGAPAATVFLVPEGEAVAAASIGQLPDDDDADPDFAEEFAAPLRQVGCGKSDEAT